MYNLNEIKMNTENKYIVSDDTAGMISLVERFDRFMDEVKKADFDLGTDLYSEIEWNALAVRDNLLDLVKMSVERNLAGKNMI